MDSDKQENNEWPDLPIFEDYGVVRITSGLHEGKLGYYDDDGFPEDVDSLQAIVYFGEPFESEYYFIPHADLEPTNHIHLPLEKFLHSHKDIADRMGVRRRS